MTHTITATECAKRKLTHEKMRITSTRRKMKKIVVEMINTAKFTENVSTLPPSEAIQKQSDNCKQNNNNKFKSKEKSSECSKYNTRSNTMKKEENKSMSNNNNDNSDVDSEIHHIEEVFNIQDPKNKQVKSAQKLMSKEPK
jgi:hypothetical protein